MSKTKTSIIPVKRVENLIILLRGQKVIIDSDLAELYGVTAKRLNEQVKRNIKRFPDDFMFQLTKDEFADLKSQFATSSSNWGGKRKLPNAFTEHGAVMAASVLNSERAVAVSIYVVRAFIKLREMMAPYKEFAKKLKQFEKKLQTHDNHIVGLAEIIETLMPSPDAKSKEPFGFRKKKAKKTSSKKGR